MKYHIFVGSTLDDLKSERKEIIRIIMELGHIPVIADYLDVDNKNSVRMLQKIIEGCDYFVALSAHKYCAADEKRFTLMPEYAIAVKKEIPVLALIIDEKARWKQTKKDTDPALVRKLNDFKAKLMKGSFQTWNTTMDLCKNAQALLTEEFIINARPGWIKADNILEPMVANELSRLSFENNILHRKLCHNDSKASLKLQDDQKKILKLLAANRVSLNFCYTTSDNWENTRQFRNIRIFKILVPELAVQKSTSEISRFLGTVLNPDLSKTVRNDYPTPSNTIKKLMADFSIFNLVRCTGIKDGKNDDEIWEITGYGRELYSLYRLRQIEKALAKKTE